MTPLELLDRGGTLAWILAALSLTAGTVAIAKALQFLIWRTVRSHATHPVQRVRWVAHHCATSCRETWRDTVAAEAVRQLARAERGLGALSAIAQLCPLLGLLGTVLGMITAFANLEAAGGRADPAILAGGIWVALLTTAMGLGIAIPVRGVLYAFESEVERLLADMNDVAAAHLGPPSWAGASAASTPPGAPGSGAPARPELSP